MKSIQVTDATYEKLDFGARVAGLTIQELLDRLTSAQGPGHWS